jgi:hypothetical protein
MLRDVLNTIVFITKTQFVIKTHYTFYNGEHACWRGVCIVYEIHLLCAVSVSTVTTSHMEVVRLLLPLKWGTIMINPPPERGAKNL